MMRDNADDRAIVFKPIDHLGFGTSGVVNHPDPDVRLWNEVIEGIEFTVYGTNDVTDAVAAAATPNVFGTPEAGLVPASGVGSTFEQATLDFVFLDGWFDHGAVDEGDDYASVWKFTQEFRYIAVYSNFTDRFPNDGFRSFDNEMNAIGVFIGDPRTSAVPEPGTVGLLATALVALGFTTRRRRRVV